jgi:hypothetical protein
MKKKNDLWQLLSALLFVAITTAGCESNSHPKSNPAKGLHYNEAYVQQVNSGDIEDDYEGSVYRVTSAIIDSFQIKILYGSPGVRNRVIWGKLVPYDTVWVSGAIKATDIEFSKDVIIGGRILKAGKYALFTIPGRKSWEIVVNTDYQQHNTSDYDIKKDVLRFDVVPDTLPKPVHRLTYTVIKGGTNDATVSLEWENLKVKFNVKLFEP